MFEIWDTMCCLVHQFKLLPSDVGTHYRRQTLHKTGKDDLQVWRFCIPHQNLKILNVDGVSLRVTKGACPPPLLRSVNLRLFRGCWKACCVGEGALGCLPSWVWRARNISLDLGPPLRNGTQVVTYHFNLQFQKITTTMSVLRLKWFFISLLDSRMIDSFFFLIGSTNCHSSLSLFCFLLNSCMIHLLLPS